MELFEDLENIVQAYLPNEHIKIIKKAYQIAKNAHEGQYRSSGEPYITHPIAVAIILAKIQLNHETIVAALLHDVIEDTPLTFEDLSVIFGYTIAELVDGVSKLDKLKFRNRKEAEAENFRKMMMAMVQDVRVIFIKLADRTHNMRTLSSLRPDKRARIAKETLEIYAPLAHRLGINHLKVELEDLGFEALHPIRYQTIRKAIEQARSNRKEMVQRILLEIENKLRSVDIQTNVYAQEKSVYAIYTKMRRHEQRFQSIMDIFSFRIIVKNIDACYRVLGQMHSLYKPKIGRFKDYISIPKANGYQSLHTTMIGPHGVPVEVLIRTKEMNSMAEFGIAASLTHQQEEANNTTKQKIQLWIKSLLELQQSASSSFEFIDSVKSDLFPRHIYVFTPKGKIVELPAGSTPIDLAYTVHTDIGNHCIGALVNHCRVPLSKKLANGQTVEILVSPDASPNADWLNFTISSKARTKIRQTLKKQKQEDSIRLGRHLLNHQLKLSGLSIETLTEEQIHTTLTHLKISSLNDLLIEIGSGNIMSTFVAKSLNNGLSKQVKITTNNDKLTITGYDNVLLSRAKCCQPIPNDNIIGFISPEKGLVIHRENCPNLIKLQSDTDRFVDVIWAKKIKELFKTQIKITLINSENIIAKLIEAITQQNSTIIHVDSNEGNGQIYTVIFSIQVNDVQHLQKVMEAAHRLLNIIAVERV